MSATGAVQSTGKGSNGFFGWVQSAAEGLGEGIRRIGSEVLPVWASDQLKVQRTDQLNRDLFLTEHAQPRKEDVVGTAAQPSRTTGQRVGLLFDNLNVSAGGLLAGAATVIGVILVWRAVQRG